MFSNVKNIELIDPKEYDFTVNELRNFFRSLGFIETPVQHRPSILAACEDPRTIATYDFAGNLWPLPQTGQMWLEYELLTKWEEKGFFCISTSYRNEPNAIPGRHNLIFPMFEFETHGDLVTLEGLEFNLLKFLGFSEPFSFGNYMKIASRYGVEEITASHEERLFKDFGPIFFLNLFPQSTSPFWNMKKVGDLANKIDVILYGVETIGSAERSTNPDEMRESFHTISNGMYAEILFAKFNKQRVEDELEKFLSLKFFPRCGGGIGINRMIRALKMAGILKA